jgi:predicted ester cyclase
MSEDHKELVRRHLEEIWNQQNLGVADELMAHDYVEHAVAPFGQAEPGRVNGPAATRQTVDWLLAQFPDLHMTVEAIVAEGDTVAVRVLSEGTNLGPLNGVVPPTGKRFSARQSHWFRVEDGKLAEHGRPVRTSRRCCSWESCSPQVGHLRRTFGQAGRLVSVAALVPPVVEGEVVPR